MKNKPTLFFFMIIHKSYTNSFLRIFIIGLLIVFSQQLLAQNKAEDLKIKRQKIEKEIDYTNKLLKKTRKNKKHTLYELQLIQNKINQRNKLIVSLRKEIDFLEKKITQTKSSIKDLNSQLDNLKAEYSRAVTFLARNNSDLDKLIFIFSAEDLNQAYQRMRYIDELTDFIRHQADSIQLMESNRKNELNDLRVQKDKKNKLLERENEQLEKLESNLQEKDKVSKSFSKKEKQLRAQLRQKQKEAKKLNQRIENIIASETKVSRSNSGVDSYALTPAEKKLADDFRNNKGKLPWPTERGFVSETFGTHAHPVLKHVMVKNNGINIVTTSGSKARAVFKGKVVSVVSISNTNIAVIVKHGNWFTVYSNLEKVFVKKGDEVTTKKPIGLIHTNLKGKTELHFEVWNGKQKQNPLYWILKR